MFAFALMLLVMLSLFIPASHLYIQKCVAKKDDIVETVTQNGIIAHNDCTIDSNGNISVTGNDAYIVFSGFNAEIQTIKLNFAKPSEKGYYAVLFYDAGEGFTESKTEREFVYIGDDSVCFSIPKTKNASLRIDIDENYAFSNVELHSKQAEEVKIPISASSEKYIAAVGIALGLGILFFVIDAYVYPMSQKAKEYYLTHYKGIFLTLLIVLVSAIISIGVELLLGNFVFGKDSTGNIFNIYRYIFICGVLSAILFLIAQIKDRFKNTDKIFAILMLHVGIIMIFCSPFGHICWDFDSHAKFVLNQSYIGDAYITEADEKVITNDELYFSKETALDNQNNIELLNNGGSAVKGIISNGFSTIAHIPAAVIVAVGRFLGFSFVTNAMLGRIANLFVYVIVCYFAIRKLNSGKMILATIAFFPTNIFLATNYSYDFWVISFSMLGMSYFISEMQQPQKRISVFDTVVMNAAFILACIPKQIYMPIMILPFFMRKQWKNKNERKNYYIICVLMFMLMFVLLAIRAFSSVTGGGDTRGGSGVNSMGQVAFILREPLQYTKILLNFLKTYLSIGSMKGYINLFAYMGSGTAAWIFIAMIIITTLTDKTHIDKFKGKGLLRIVSIVLFFGLACLVSTSMYVAFTPVASESILGCQSRYLTPAIFPLLITIANPGIVFKIKKELYNTICLVILSGTVLYNIAFAFLPKLM